MDIIPRRRRISFSTQWTLNHDEGHLVLSGLDSSCSKCKINFRPARGEFNRSQNETSNADGTIYHSLLLLWSQGLEGSEGQNLTSSKDGNFHHSYKYEKLHTPLSYRLIWANKHEWRKYCFKDWGWTSLKARQKHISWGDWSKKIIPFENNPKKASPLFWAIFEQQSRF